MFTRKLRNKQSKTEKGRESGWGTVTEFQDLSTILGQGTQPKSPRSFFFEVIFVSCSYFIVLILILITISCLYFWAYAMCWALCNVIMNHFIRLKQCVHISFYQAHKGYKVYPQSCLCGRNGSWNQALWLPNLCFDHLLTALLWPCVYTPPWNTRHLRWGWGEDGQGISAARRHM